MAAVLIVPAGTAAQPGRSGAVSAISFSAYVPLACAASLEHPVVSIGRGTIDLGALTESCNSAHGYALYATSSADLAGARLIIDGRTFRLRGTVPILIASTAGPGSRQRRVSLQLSPAMSGTIALRIAPL